MRLTILLFLASQCNLFAANYYLSQKGNDHNTGTTSDQPWRSLRRLNEFLPNAQNHDSVFFERGSNFNGQLKISVPGLYLGAYGSGTEPVISGSVKLGTWTNFKGNIWKADCLECAETLNNLFIDGTSQPLGRYPNDGYQPISKYRSDQKTLWDETSMFPNNYWNGAEIVIRSSRWTIDKIQISEYTDKAFHLNEKPSYELEKGMGYFIQKHPSTLDHHGEWFYDTTTNLIYAYFNAEFFPDEHVIEASMTEVGLDAQYANDLTVENLVFARHNLTGIRLDHCDHPQLNKIEILHSGRNGLELISCNDPVVKNSQIIGSNNNGVDWSNASGGTLIHNRIERTGLQAGRGESGNGTYIAIYIISSAGLIKETVIEGNTIDSTGYSGIDFRTRHTQLRNNHVSNFCIAKDDGAGLYTWNNVAGDNIIEGNIIKNGIGTGKGTTDKNALYVSGIYMDDNSSQVLIRDNVVSNCSMAGIFLHNANHIQLIRNTLFANGNNVDNREKGQLLIKTDRIVPRKDNTSLNIESTGNSLTATSEISFCLYISTERKSNHWETGRFVNNQFSAIHPHQSVAQSNDELDPCFGPRTYNLDEWQAASQNEKGSLFKQLLSKGNQKMNSHDIITSDHRTAALQGWMTWPEKSFIEKEGDGALYGQEMKINVPKEITEALLYHAGIFLKEDKLYKITFSAKSTTSNKIEFVPLMAHAPWTALGKYACFPVDSSYQTFAYYFRGYKNNIEGRVNFKSNATFSIKDITLTEVMTKSHEKTKTASLR